MGIRMTIQSKYNELKLKKERTTLILYLNHNYQFFGSNLKIFGFLTDKSFEELKELFNSYSIICKLEGEILQCKWKISEERNVKNLEFFCHLNQETGVLQIFTFMPASELYYIDKIIKNTSGMHYLWISP